MELDVDSTEIINLLKDSQSIVIVGPTNTGKSYWVRETFIPALERVNISFSYFPEAEDMKQTDADICIFDEVETFFDKEYLEERHPEEVPYYLESYVEKVKKWHQKYKEFKQPSVYIITRNEPEEIEYLTNNFNTTDWDGRDVVVKYYY